MARRISVISLSALLAVVCLACGDDPQPEQSGGDATPASAPAAPPQYSGEPSPMLADLMSHMSIEEVEAKLGVPRSQWNVLLDSTLEAEGECPGLNNFLADIDPFRHYGFKGVFRVSFINNQLNGTTMQMTRRTIPYLEKLAADGHRVYRADLMNGGDKVRIGTTDSYIWTLIHRDMMGAVRKGQRVLVVQENAPLIEEGRRLTRLCGGREAAEAASAD